MAAIEFSSNPSLNEIVSSLAARVNKQHDVAFMDELKHIANYKRASALNLWMLKMNTKEFLYQTYYAETERVTTGDICANFPSTCYIVRTKCKVPAPFRDPNFRLPHNIFDYVGHISGYMPYAYAQPEAYEYNKHKVYTSGNKKWYYEAGYIYIVNDKDEPPGPIKFRGVFQNPMSERGCDICNENGEPCEKDTAPWPVPPELLNDIVKAIISEELRVGDVPKEVDEEKDTIKVDSVEQIQHRNT